MHSTSQLSRQTLTLAALVAGWIAVAGVQLAAAEGTSHPQSLPTTAGVNYPFVDDAHHPDYISSAPLRFEVDGRLVGGGPFRLGAEAPSSCSGPCNAPAVSSEAGGHSPEHSYLNCDIEGTAAECQLTIHRFAQHGRSEEGGFDWLVTMVDDEGLLGGRMKTRLGEDGALEYPAPAVLGGHMIVTVQMDGMPPMRLRSREEPIFEGKVLGWPPHGSVFELSNPPIEYFLESQVDKPDAKPLMVIDSNRVQLGDHSADFFAVRPELTSIKRRRGSNRLTWTDTAAKLEDQNIGRYYVYRSETPEDLASWKRIATLPAEQTSYRDREGSRKSHYLVSHAQELPFDYWYEGLFDWPTPVGGR